ncbi:MAG: M56 family metallopeptidase [Acidobacteriota bacterium]|nr:M56 family metallopeptidase [Acidobacteriota bacterium]
MFWAWASLLIRSGLILIAADVLRRFARQDSGKYRHRILLAAFALLLSWPLFSAVLPQIHVPLWPRTSTNGTVTFTQTIVSFDKALPQTIAVNWPLTIWLVGVLLSLVPVILDYVAVRRLIRRAIPLADAGWRDLLERTCASLDLTAIPELLIYSGPVVPFTFGLWRPRILLPADCMDWAPLRKHAVLLHELAHIKRRDLWSQMVATFATALWWFQPLCWFNRWNLRRESERACDALVLDFGIRPSDYARELLDIARSFSKGQRWSSAAALTMARRGELEGRLYAILDPERNGAGRRPVLAIAALTALTLTASAVTVLPEQSSLGGHPMTRTMKRTLISGLLASAGLSAATIGGSVFDPTGAALANAQASLFNPETSAKQDTTTTPDGKFTFTSLAAGSYILHVEKPGFASLYREFNVQTDSDVRRGLILTAAPSDQNPRVVRVGGSVEESNLIRKVQPTYPDSAKTARIQGAVHLETTISKEGVPEDIRVVSSPSDDLTQSALEAVRQWRYRPTLLNGQPVDIVTDVTVNYTLMP